VHFVAFVETIFNWVKCGKVEARADKANKLKTKMNESKHKL